MVLKFLDTLDMKILPTRVPYNIILHLLRFEDHTACVLLIYLIVFVIREINIYQQTWRGTIQMHRLVCTSEKLEKRSTVRRRRRCGSHGGGSNFFR